MNIDHVDMSPESPNGSRATELALSLLTARNEVADLEGVPEDATNIYERLLADVATELANDPQLLAHFVHVTSTLSYQFVDIAVRFAKPSSSGAPRRSDLIALAALEMQKDRGTGDDS